MISAAAGGVGSLAVQIAKLLGAGTVIGLASTEDKRAKVKELGADAAIDYTQDGWAGAGQGRHGRQRRGHLSGCQRATTQDGGLKPLAKGGHWVVYGAQSASETGLSGAALQGMIFGGQTLRGWTRSTRPPLRPSPQTLKQLIAWNA